MANQVGRPNPLFELAWNRGGITGLKLAGDVYDTEYIWQGETLGDVVVRYRMGDGAWREATAFSSGDIRQVHASPEDRPDRVAFAYPENSSGVHGIRDFRLRIEFALEGDALFWHLHFTNPTTHEIEFGDIALPLPFNKEFRPDNTFNYTCVVARHSFISGHGSFIYWMRPNGVGPYLMMTPLKGTHLEYYEHHDRDVRAVRVPYWVYIHSGVRGAGETRGTWRQPHTMVRLPPHGKLEYGFKFQWADDYSGVRDVLYQQGLFDIQVVPGMTVPSDLSALLAVRTRQRDFTLSAEFPAQTKIEALGEKEQDTYLYQLIFARLGENLITIDFDETKHTILEFFVTEPVETLIKKRATFLTNKQQHRDASKWWNGLFSMWDMRDAELRGPDDTDGFDRWWGYVLACDDIALPKAPFIAAKNVSFPDPKEIKAIEYYLEHFVWGKLQRTDNEEPYPYGIYGVPNWFENRYNEFGTDSDGRGAEHLWRSYDYPHLVTLYYRLFQIARQYPHLTRYLDAESYLERAFGTARAFFTYQHLLPRWGFSFYRRSNWAYTLGIMNEAVILELVAALASEGRAADANWLKGEWEKKVKYFVYDEPYPFDSEYPTDTTAFESSHAIAKYGLENLPEPDENLWHDETKDRWYSHPDVKRQDFEAFMEKQIHANIALRGWLEPAFYLLGSDLRGGEGVRYLLSYMSQLGGWAIVDYALHHARDPFPFLRLGYASYLSSWALMNTGTAETNYGYWYPGTENDGASGWAFTPEKYGPMWIRKHNARGAWFYDGEIDLGYIGALRTAATIVAEDPLFGWFAYGGELTTTEDSVQIVPRDGLRQRFHFITAAQRVHLTLEWDGFAAEHPIVIKQDLSEISFTIENRTRSAHGAILTMEGLGLGKYEIKGIQAGAGLTLSPHAKARVLIDVGNEEMYNIRIRRVQDD